ncbi:hypothetical protein ABFS83_11G117700 [Erythranthe nasuta]
MGEVKDPKIKLFGKTIELPETSAATAAAAAEENVVAAQSCEVAGEDSSNQDPPCSSNSNGDAEDQESLKIQFGSKQDDVKEKDQTEQDQSETENSDEKTLKKPDKILPCPRCNSMETKFCYFNNYNVNQPRHFCKNCQRYWTAGGTMRNVPVGAGRRRNKNVGPTQLRHQNVPPEALQTLRANPNPSNPTLCESMVSVLNIADKKIPNKGDEPSKGETGLHEKLPNCPPYFPGAAWPNYPWQVVPLYPTPPPPYWGCTVQPLQPWSVPWVIPQMPSSSGGPNSPTLGKRNLDEEEIQESEGKSEKLLWVPKTLRIDDPGEAAKSSIWATLGIKNDGVDSSGGGLFEPFERGTKSDEKVPEASTTALQANPAAMSRSVSFRESSSS